MTVETLLPIAPSLSTSVIKTPTIKTSKLSTPPVKINVKTGRGTPGGFSGKAKSGIKSVSLPKIPSKPSIPKV